MAHPLEAPPADALATSRQAGDARPSRSASLPYDPLATQWERWVAAARPRLLRLARSRGIAPDSIDDVVQETLVEAWRHLDRLSSPGAFNAWLDAICRNVCRRHARKDDLLARREAQQPWHSRFEFMEWIEPGESALTDISDPTAHDPIEELAQQDLELLLDRALGYLPQHLRRAVELCYIAELPQREAALRMGLTIRALESQLLRARRRLRQLLSGELRAEAEALELVSNETMIGAGWRETRLWCWWCGRRRIRGVFESLPDGRVALAMRCPGCARAFNTHGIVPLDGVRSFGRAYTRLTRYLTAYLTQGVTSGWQTCVFCGARQPVQLAGAEQLGDRRGRWPGLQARIECGACGQHLDSPVGTLVWSHPAAQHFFAQHPRWIAEPEALVDYQGARAIHVQLGAGGGAARLTLLADAQTLQVLATGSD
jgi:RNA polymerase sigma factor (sigma-70 family)